MRDIEDSKKSGGLMGKIHLNNFKFEVSNLKYFNGFFYKTFLQSRKIQKTLNKINLYKILHQKFQKFLSYQ